MCCGASSVNSYECVGGEKDKAQLGCRKETLRARQSFCRQSSVSVPVGYRNEFQVFVLVEIPEFMIRGN